MFILGWWVLQCALSAVSAPGSGLCIVAVCAVLPDVTLVTAMINVLHHSDQHNLDVWCCSRGLGEAFRFSDTFTLWYLAKRWKLIVKCCWLRFLCAVAWQQRAVSNDWRIPVSHSIPSHRSWYQSPQFLQKLPLLTHFRPPNWIQNNHWTHSFVVSIYVRVDNFRLQ